MTAANKSIIAPFNPTVLATTGVDWTNGRTGAAAGSLAWRTRQQPHLFDYISDTPKATIEAGSNVNDLATNVQAFATAGGGAWCDGLVYVGAEIAVPAGCRIEGVGRSRSLVRQILDNASALVVGCDDVHLARLGIQAVGSGTSYTSYNGAGIKAIGRSRLTLDRVKVTNHKTWGVILKDCTDCVLDHLRFESAAIGGGNWSGDTTQPTHDLYFADLGMIGSSIRNKVRWLYSNSGQAFPILVQSASGVACTVVDNLIFQCHVEDGLGHNISYYNINVITGLDTWSGNRRVGCTSKNAKGSLVYWNPADGSDAKNGTKQWSACFYDQGNHGGYSEGNYAEGGCQFTYSLTQLSLGAYGIVNTPRFTSVNDRSKGSYRSGMDVSNANGVGLPDNAAVVVGGAADSTLGLSDRIIIKGFKSEDSVEDGLKITAVNNLDAYDVQPVRSARDGIRLVSLTRTIPAGYTGAAGSFSTVNGDVNIYDPAPCDGAQTGINVVVTTGSWAKVGIYGGKADRNGCGISFAASSATNATIDGTTCNFNTVKSSQSGRGLNIATGNTFLKMAPGPTTNNTNGNVLTPEFPESVATIADADKTVGVTSALTQVLTSIATTGRSLTVTTTGRKPFKLRPVRAAGATGAGTWTIGGVLVLTAEKQWGELEWDGTTLRAVGYGTLP